MYYAQQQACRRFIASTFGSLEPVVQFRFFNVIYLLG